MDSPRIRLSAAVAVGLLDPRIRASPFCHGRNLFVSIPAESLLVKKEADLSRGPRPRYRPPFVPPGRSRIPDVPRRRGRVEIDILVGDRDRLNARV
jgi:hypothetical protein